MVVEKYHGASHTPGAAGVRGTFRNCASNSPFRVTQRQGGFRHARVFVTKAQRLVRKIADSNPPKPAQAV